MITSKISLKNKILYLERKIAFIENKLETYENAEGPCINTLPIKIYDIVPIHEQCFFLKGFFLLALIIKKNDKHSPIIKVSEDILKIIANSENVITITDYIHTEMFAEKTIINKEWIWKRIA